LLQNNGLPPRRGSETGYDHPAGVLNARAGPSGSDQIQPLFRKFLHSRGIAGTKTDKTEPHLDQSRKIWTNLDNEANDLQPTTGDHPIAPEHRPATLPIRSAQLVPGSICGVNQAEARKVP